MDRLKKTTYGMYRKVFLTRAHTLVNIYHELYETRSKENQVKDLSVRKAEKEVHAADTLYYNLFLVKLSVRFKRRWKSPDKNMETFLSFYQMEWERFHCMGLWRIWTEGMEP